MSRPFVTGALVDVVGLGASSVDYVNLLPQAAGTPGAYAKLQITSHFISCGGQVATMLTACRALGLGARYLGPIGSDENARRIREELARRHVDLSSVIVHDAANQFAIILVDETTGERTVLWHRDSRLALDERELDAALFSARVLHVDDVDEASAIRAARLATGRGVLVTSDLDRVTERTHELVASVSVPIFAEHVPGALTGEADQERALRKLRKRHAGLLCVTLGNARGHGARRRSAHPLAGLQGGRGGHDGIRRHVPCRLRRRYAGRVADDRDSPVRQRRRGGELHAARGDRRDAVAARD